jgi:sulfoxide reductase heme-binding subunit YedZ
MARATRRRLVQLAAVLAGCLPAAWLAATALYGDLGANPIETVTHVTGSWALNLLCVTLAVTPARRLLGWSWLAPLRRSFGLLAFGYACLHLLTFVGLDHFFDWDSIVEDVVERRFVTAGFAAFLCLAPLAATSTAGMMKRLGRRWNVLHRLVYVAAALAVAHFWWLVKADEREPLVYAGLLALLLGTRLRRRAASRASATRPVSC